MHINTELKIPEDARVLEIGGGGFPHPKTSLILDKFLQEEGTRQRGGTNLLIDRPFVHADACKMPFLDKSFDYVIASHVIEHIPEAEIESFVREINRVGDAGYIEAPGPLYETLRDIPEHLWFVVCADNTVHIAPKRKKDIPPQKQLINPMFYDPGFSPIHSSHSDIWHTGMEWSNSFDLQFHEFLNELWAFYNEEEIIEKIKKRVLPVQATQTNARVFDAQFVKLVKNTSIWKMLSFMKHQIFKKTGQLPERIPCPWRELVVCPNCFGQLREKGSTLNCDVCKIRFNILEGDIPSFVTPVKL